MAASKDTMNQRTTTPTDTSGRRFGRVRWSGLAAAAGLALTAAVGLGLAQPGDAEPGAAPPADATTSDAGVGDGSPALRARLERVIERGEAMLERHRDALARLDAGESPADVMRTLRLRDFDRQATVRASAREDRPAVAARQGVDDDADDARPRRPGRVSQTTAEGFPAGTGIDLEPEMRARLRAFLTEHLPGVSEQLAQVEAADSEMGARLFNRLIPQLRDVVMATDRDPAYGALKLAELRAGLEVVDATQRVRSLSAGAGNGDGTGDATALDAAREELRAAIAARFDARIRLREHELERLAEQITELHRQIEDERRGRDAEVDRVYEAVLTQRWGRPGPGARRGAERPGNE